MAKLSEEGLLAIHQIISEHYPLKFDGIQHPNKIKPIVERPELIVYGHEPYDTIFKKSAVLMEGVIRSHIFFDGNKRTGLMTAFAYLQNNNYYLAMPIDVVRYTVQVATNKSRDDQEIEDLINNIAIWLENHSSTSYWGFVKKVLRYTTLPSFGLLFAYFLGFRKYADKKADDWYQLRFHSDYSEEHVTNTSNLIKNSIRDSVKAITNSKSK